MRVLEIYSGIGGMRYSLENALDGSGQVIELVAHLDISTIAEQVYQWNHHDATAATPRVNIIVLFFSAI
jgi:site-specific DNA-cytosine methylase